MAIMNELIQQIASFCLSILPYLRFICVAIYYTLESIILTFVPKRFRFKDISSEIVLITGGGNGIGRQMARKFSKLAAKIVLLDINGKDLNDTVNILKNDGASCEIFNYECDVSNKDMVYATAAKIQQEVGTVTILINNAGIVSGKKLLLIPDESIKRTMDVNATAHFWTCKAFLPKMIEANHGHIVSIASLAGYIGLPQLTDYCASKFAAVGFLEALRQELATEGKTGIKLTLVAPYHITTDLFHGFKGFLKGRSAEWVAEQIVSGVLVNQEVLSVPSFFYFTSMLVTILPPKVMRELYDLTGLSMCMNEFKGRKM